MPTVARREVKGGGEGVAPSPTRNWYSGPEGFVRVLFVSTMGSAEPAARAALYVAGVGYRGGGGRTLWTSISHCYTARGMRPRLRDSGGGGMGAAAGQSVYSKRGSLSYNMVACRFGRQTEVVRGGAWPSLLAASLLHYHRSSIRHGGGIWRAVVIRRGQGAARSRSGCRRCDVCGPIRFGSRLKSALRVGFEVDAMRCGTWTWDVGTSPGLAGV